MHEKVVIRVEEEKFDIPGSKNVNLFSFSIISLGNRNIGIVSGFQVSTLLACCVVRPVRPDKKSLHCNGVRKSCLRCFLKRGNLKSDTSLKSKSTIEKTTRQLGKSFLLQKYQNFG